MTTTPAYRCSLCHAPLANGTPAELAFHGATCEGVMRWWDRHIVRTIKYQDSAATPSNALVIEAKRILEGR